MDSHDDRISDDHRTVLLLQAYNLAQCGRFKEASIILDVLVSLFPRDIEILLQACFVSVQRANWPAVSEILYALERRIPSSDPRSQSLRWMRMKLLAAAGRTAEARTLLHSLVSRGQA